MLRRIWVLGDAVIDLLPETHHRLLQCPGGAPANVAVGIARLGGNSAFIGCVGGDPFGDFMRIVLTGEGVDTSAMHALKDQRTSTVLVSLDECGERHFTFMVRPSADLFLTKELLPAFQKGEGLHLCSIALSANPSRDTAFNAMKAIKAAGGWVSFDPNLRDDLWTDQEFMMKTVDEAMRHADIIKLSLEELETFTGSSDLDESIPLFTQRYQPHLLLITQGKEGVTVWQEHTLQHFPAQRVNAVDTTGAGDAFVAGLLAALAKEENPLSPHSLADAIGQAQRCGALATTAKGAMTALPYAEALSSL